MKKEAAQVESHLHRISCLYLPCEKAKYDRWMNENEFYGNAPARAVPSVYHFKDISNCMTPKEKANNLFKLFFTPLYKGKVLLYIESKDNAITKTRICVKEIISASFNWAVGDTNYWEQVLKELDNI